MIRAPVELFAASLSLFAATQSFAARGPDATTPTFAPEIANFIAQAETKDSHATVEGVGVITGVEPGRSQLTVNHEKIKDFMEAMEMTYAVSNPALLNGLKVGDKVVFSIDPATYTIVDLHVVDQAK
jgi:Cu/Ag efflux protein CusF